ncbi:MAG: hypothetical protein Q8Q08_08215 [Candidatus Omnitrophota bacterium]|nr:hypothetical protein [Candidatus Omnitrophota bacterium]MDZ4242386.1 hypothetical protein [Candidatus Omnitrophota bacterium]
MKQENMRSLESLSAVCHYCGVFSVFIGSVVIFMDFLRKDFEHIQTGIFQFAIGYALVKVSSRIAMIVMSEKIER